MINQCSIALLEAALAGSLPSPEEASLQRHLEECEACGAALERMAGGDAWRQEAASLLVADELDATAPVQGEWSEVDFTVEHLEASDEPNVLGRLGGYDVLDIIGRGGMGVVLKAFDRELKRLVAIKMLAPHLAHSSLAKKRFAREAQAAAAVVHPNVLAIHHVQPNARLPFLVMPLVAGESLAERLATKGALELKEVLRIGMQAAAGLAAAHEQGLVHRDVKPANILLEMGVERAVLTDFGLARAADDVSLTRWGIIAGTPQYMSPEQAKGEPLDGRSDLFSLGCVLYEMATGVSPFRTDSVMATMRRLVDDAPKAIASLNPELPPWFIAIVDRLLEKEPSRRFDSAKEVSELLAGCLAHLQQPASVPLPASPTRSREVREPGKWWRHFTRPSTLYVCLFASCVVAALALGIFYGLAQVDEPEVKQKKQELHLPLRGIPDDRDGWEFIGPNAKQCVKYEPEGLRITLPAGFPKERPGTGLRIPMPAHGDFEVTIHYEILAEPDQASVGPLPTKLIFQAQLKRKDYAVAAIARRVHSDKGIQFTTWTIRDNHDNSGTRQMKARQHTAKAKVGRLRIVRTGSEASFYAAEGPEADFILLPPPRHMGEEDLKCIELVGSTGSLKATLDVRFTDLRVRTSVAASPPKASAEAPGVPEAPETPMPPPRRHLWILLSLLTVGLLVVPLGIWLRLRRGRGEQAEQQASDIDAGTDAPADAMTPLAFRCPGCDKPLKARAALAGKKIKCPGCGKAVRAPAQVERSAGLILNRVGPIVVGTRVDHADAAFREI